MPCCKLAWDHYDPRYLATYAAVHRVLLRPLTYRLPLILPVQLPLTLLLQFAYETCSGTPVVIAVLGENCSPRWNCSPLKWTAHLFWM